MDVARTRLFSDTGTPDWAEILTPRSPEEASANVWKSASGKQAFNVEAPFILNIFTLVGSADLTSVTGIELSMMQIMIITRISCVSICNGILKLIFHRIVKDNKSLIIADWKFFCFLNWINPSTDLSKLNFQSEWIRMNPRSEWFGLKTRFGFIRIVASD